ncbi:MAG: Ig-like domain-containing protein [Gemmatimonadales bacterium]
MRRTLVRTCWIFAALIAACSDNSPSGVKDLPLPDPTGLVLSDPSSVAASSGRSVVPSATITAYVSAVPGTLPDAISAIIRNKTAPGAEYVTKVVAGGFDPVPVLAGAGDELSLELWSESGRTVLYLSVPPRRPPGVVRTNPSKGRTDVALNVQITVVFTEPIDESTLTEKSLMLKQSGVAVKGILTLSVDGLIATFTPQRQLLPDRTYELEVTREIRDLDGEQLDAADVETFTTSGDSGGSGPNTDRLAGTLAFVSTREGVPHIYLSNPDGSGIRRLTNSSQAEYTPAWSRDGKLLAFNGDDGTYVIRNDGSGLLRVPRGGGWPSWSPDGKQLLVAAEGGLRIVRADGSEENEVAIVLNGPLKGDFAGNGPIDPLAANWSPDGKQISFATWTSWEFVRAFVVNVDGSNGRTFVGAVQSAIWDECGPVWSPDGSRVALLGGVFGGAFPRAVFAVGIVDPGSGRVTTIAATGTTCWDANYGGTTSFSGIAWSPDGLSLAITRRDPPWVQGRPDPTNQQASIAIVNIQTKAVSAVIPDAYDPAWSRVP